MGNVLHGNSIQDPLLEWKALNRTIMTLALQKEKHFKYLISRPSLSWHTSCVLLTRSIVLIYRDIIMSKIFCLFCLDLGKLNKTWKAILLFVNSVACTDHWEEPYCGGLKYWSERSRPVVDLDEQMRVFNNDKATFYRMYIKKETMKMKGIHTFCRSAPLNWN